MSDDPGALATSFRRFAERECAGYCAVYEDLATRVAEDPEVLALVGERLPGQPPPNLLFGAVRYLLAGDPKSALALAYARADAEGPNASAAVPWALFRAYALEHVDEIRRIALARRVQTNEVGRSPVLRAGVAAALAGDPSPVALVDFGASAGLHLLLDRWRIVYRREGGGTVECGPVDSALSLECEVRGGVLPPTDLRAPVVARIGIDLDPVDVRDEDAVRWLEALVWPGQPERARRLRLAVEVARRSPPDLVLGDAADLLPGVLRSLPAGATACVMHSATWYQLAPGTRERIEAALAEAARERPVARVGLVSANRPFDLYVARARERASTHVARAHPHGAWIEWFAPPAQRAPK